MHIQRLTNKGKTGYAGYNMPTSCILPGAYSLARLPVLSPGAKRRLQWMDWYRAHGNNASLTCRHFGIARETFYTWKRRYDPYHLESLNERSRRPRRTRSWEVSRMEEFRILRLRRQHLRWGKEKLKVVYQREYHTPVSSWKIQRVIEKHGLYFSPARTEAMRRKRRHNQAKKRITELKKETRTGFLVALDTVVRYWAGIKRYILTGIDTHSKIAFARMYHGHGSRHAADFLRRIHYLFEGDIDFVRAVRCKGKFLEEFVNWVCDSVRNSAMPLTLVDLGGMLLDEQDNFTPYRSEVDRAERAHRAGVRWTHCHR